VNGLPPSSTFFSVPPGWEWMIVLYFFFGGLAGGCYFFAAVIDLFGRAEDEPLARAGYLVAFPLVALSGLLLTVDLGRPLRFWHMLIQSNTGRPMFKYWSPMSTGAWALLVFGLFTFVSFVIALSETGRIPWRAPAALRTRSIARGVIAAIGGIFGFYIAGYTGVLLAVTNRPIWSDTPFLGMVFMISAASTSAALMMLIALRNRWTMPGITDLHRVDAWLIVLELVALAVLMVSLGPVLRAWLNAWGVLMLIVIVFGLVVPLAMRWRRSSLIELSAVLVLVGGFLLRFVIVFSAESM